MSFFKWTLALAGTAVGMRYMSNRHRPRSAHGVGNDELIDRDSSRDARTPWSTAQSGGAGTGLGGEAGSSTGLSCGTSASSTAGSDAAGFGQADALSPHKDPVAGSSSNRY